MREDALVVAGIVNSDTSEVQLHSLLPSAIATRSGVPVLSCLCVCLCCPCAYSLLNREQRNYITRNVSLQIVDDKDKTKQLSPLVS